MSADVRARSGCPVLLALLLGLGVCGVSSRALANGRFPGARQIAIHPADPSTLMLRTTFGQMLTRDDGQTFRWLCEEVIGYGGTQDPAIVITADSSLLNAAYEGTSVSADGGCSFAFATGLKARYSVDLALDTSTPSRVLLVVAANMTAGLPAQLWETSDNGATWSVVSELVPNFFPQNVDVARSDPQRVYVTGLQKTNVSSQASLLRSDDGGKTWQQRDLPLDKLQNAYLSAVDPQDKQRLYVRVEGSTEDELLRSTDGGETYQSLAVLPGGMLGFALSPDGSRIAIGGPTGGVLVAHREDEIFSPRSATPVTCLAWGSQGLYACGVDEISSGFAMARSDDEGTTFSPLLAALGDTCGPLETCGATSLYAMTCPGRWPAIEALLRTTNGPPLTCDQGLAGAAGVGGGAASSGAAGQTSAGADGSDGTSDPSADPVSEGGGGCQLAANRGHEPWGLVGLVLALLFRSRRRAGSARSHRSRTHIFSGLVVLVTVLLSLTGVACSTSSQASEETSSSQGGTNAGEGGHPNAAGTAGEKTTVEPRPLQVSPLYYGGNGVPFEPIGDGATLVLSLPPQGGRVLWIGAEVVGVTATEFDIRGRLRSKATGAIVAEELRSVTIRPVEEGADAMRPFPRSMRNVTNLPVCPNYGDEEILNQPLELEVTVMDPSTDPPGLGVVSLNVTLVCAQGATNCPCECSLGYVLGTCGPTGEIPPDL